MWDTTNLLTITSAMTPKPQPKCANGWLKSEDTKEHSTAAQVAPVSYIAGNVNSAPGILTWYMRIAQYKPQWQLFRSFTGQI